MNSENSPRPDKSEPIYRQSQKPLNEGKDTRDAPRFVLPDNTTVLEQGQQQIQTQISSFVHATIAVRRERLAKLPRWTFEEPKAFLFAPIMFEFKTRDFPLLRFRLPLLHQVGGGPKNATLEFHDPSYTEDSFPNLHDADKLLTTVKNTLLLVKKTLDFQK